MPNALPPGGKGIFVRSVSLGASDGSLACRMASATQRPSIVSPANARRKTRRAGLVRGVLGGTTELLFLTAVADAMMLLIISGRK